MNLTTMIITNGILAFALVYALVFLLTHAIHADRRHRSVRIAEIRALPEHRRDRVAA